MQSCTRLTSWTKITERPKKVNVVWYTAALGWIKTEFLEKRQMLYSNKRASSKNLRCLQQIPKDVPVVIS